MKVFINNKEMVIFRGACIGDVLLMYSKRSLDMVRRGYFGVFDRFGNLTELDGPLTEGQRFTIKRLNQK
jgi:hypothetical protein